MTATITYIEQKFSEFNRMMFGGKLPRIPVELSDAKTFLGQCVCRKRRLPDGRIERYDFRLRINTRIDLPEREVEDTIIHEMIHYYIGVNNLKDTSAHGPLFQHLMNSINEKFGRHLTISHKTTAEQREQSYDTRQRWHVVALVSFKDGRTGVKVLPRVLPRILNYYNMVGSDSKIEDVRLFMSNDIYFNRFPNSSALTAAFVDGDELTSHLQGAEELRCDGNKIIRGK